MKKKNTFLTISILSFIISAAFSINLFTSNSVGRMATLLMFTSAVVLEMAKWTLLWEGFSGKHNGTLSGILVGLWAFVTIGSIAASCGYVLNQSNQTQNNALISSTQYKQAEQARQIKISTYNNKAAEIDQLRQQAAELPKNYFSMKQNIMDKVAQKSKELSSLSDEIKKPIDVKAELPISGYSAFFGLMAKLFDEDAKMIELWFFIALGIVLELIANVFAYLYQKERNYAPKNAEIQPTGDSKRYSYKYRNTKKQSFAPNVVPLKNYAPKNHTNQSQPKLYSEKDIEDYIRVMYENQKNGYSPGTKLMADLLGWGRSGEEKARGIKNYLELKGMVEVVGSRTRIRQVI